MIFSYTFAKKKHIHKKSKCLNLNIFVMNKINEKDVFKGVRYFPPDITIMEVKVEKGFADYPTKPVDDPDEVNP